MAVANIMMAAILRTGSSSVASHLLGNPANRPCFEGTPLPDRRMEWEGASHSVSDVIEW